MHVVRRRKLQVGMATALLALGAVLGTLLVFGSSSQARVEFEITDDPGRWFANVAGPVGGSNSLAVVTPGTRVDFSHRSRTVHTVTSLLFPTGAEGMPFETGAMKGSVSLNLRTPGLYVFLCQIHPFMFAGVIVDDPATEGLDLGETITLINGATIPTSSDLATRLVRSFFIATNPGNWQDYASGAPWHVTYADVPVRITGGLVANFRAVLNERYGNDLTLEPTRKPVAPGIGEVWVDTQFELTSGKEKPGTATAVDAVTWLVTRKVALPDIKMNNPHNMWTDRDQELIFQTQWFDHRLTVFDRRSGRLVENISVGESPAHVITRPNTDQVYVTINGADRNESVVELAPRGTGVERRLDIGAPHPHGPWITSDGSKLITPNTLSDTASIFNFATGKTDILRTGSHPIAVGIMPDGSKAYVANFVDSTLTVVDLHTLSTKTINLLANYDPINGAITGPVGGLPIQTPVSPDGKFVVVANTLTATITIIDTAMDSLVAMLPADPGAHGINFGAKQGGGYYAYVTNKFSNRLIIVDPDPNGDGSATDAAIAGSVALVATSGTSADAAIAGNAGMGGQGVLPIPVVYNGWVQRLPASWADQLTPAQRNPLP
ncbi:MAG: copper oxidase [Chloroflexi bacterium]|nr:copper oxidase [Chloroflexota bacterium]